MSSEWPLTFRSSDQNSVCISHLSHACHMPLQFHPRLETLAIFSEAYKLWSSLLCSDLQPLATSSLLGPNVLLSGLISNTLSLYKPKLNLPHNCGRRPTIPNIIEIRRGVSETRLMDGRTDAEVRHNLPIIRSCYVSCATNVKICPVWNL
jgi:hypothetical protein